MFEKDAEEYAIGLTYPKFQDDQIANIVLRDVEGGFQKGAETTLRKIVKYFSTRVLDENCGGYFSRLLESEEKFQELAKELENV